MSRAYQHPDGHTIDFADNWLTVTDSNGKSVSVPIGTYGLLTLADALESAAGGVQGNDGLTMPTKGNGLDATNDQPVKTLTNHTADFIAICARLKGAVSGFYLNRGIGLDSIVMLILVAVFAAVRALQ